MPTKLPHSKKKSSARDRQKKKSSSITTSSMEDGYDPDSLTGGGFRVADDAVVRLGYSGIESLSYEEIEQASQFVKRLLNDGAITHRDSSAIGLIFFTDVQDGPPEHGFLLPDTSEVGVPCLHISLESAPDETCHKLLRMSFEVGLLNTRCLSAYPVKISFKQTRQQNWASQIFETVVTRFPGVDFHRLNPSPILRDFYPAPNSVIGVSDPVCYRSLAITFLLEYWQRNTLTFNQKICQLRDLNITDRMTDQNYGVIINRLGFKIEYS